MTDNQLEQFADADLQKELERREKQHLARSVPIPQHPKDRKWDVIMNRISVKMEGAKLTYTHSLIPGAEAELIKLSGEHEPYFVRVFLPHDANEAESVELVREAVRMMRILNNK